MINKFDGEYAFLSNFADSCIEFEGITYPTVEHAFQAAKTLDEDERLYISSLPTPGAAKKQGRRVSLRPDWEQVKYSVMEECVSKKFAQEPLRSQLLSTGDEPLEEGTWWHDNIWGNCYCAKCANIEGKNYLGKILMKTRQEIKEKALL